MKKVFKMLAVVLALTLVIGVIPVSAATEDVSLKKTSKTLYLGGCKGAKANGKAASYYSYAKLAKLFNNLGSDMKVRAASSNTDVVKATTTKLVAVGTGTADITLTVYNGKVRKANIYNTYTMKVTVKKNAEDADVTFKGIKDGASFEVGDSVTISLPRNKDNDNRRLTCSDKSVEIVSAGTRKWTVTFTKGGTFTLLAEAFQSATYAKATASKTISVTVKDSAVPTATPTPTAAPTPTPVPEPVDTLTAAQLTSRSFSLAGSVIFSDLEADDITIEYDIAGLKASYNLGKTIEVADGTATVSLFSALTAGTTYYVTVDDVTTEFTACSTETKDVTAIKIATTKVLAGSNQDIEYKYFNGNVDITSEVSGALNSSLTVEQLTGDEYAILYGSASIYFIETGRSSQLKATCTLGYDFDADKAITVTDTATIVSYTEPSPTLTGVIYTITDDDGIYMTKNDTQVLNLAMEESKVIEALFVYSNGEYKTFDEVGITKILVNGSNILIKSDYVISGGKALYPIATGTARLDCYAGETYIASMTVNVVEKRVAKTLAVTLSQTRLNVNALVSDSLTITAVVKDQYGDVMKDVTPTITQKQATIDATGSVAFGAFYDGQLTVYGTDVYLNPDSAGIISATVKYGDLSQDIRFTVKDSAYDTTKFSSYVKKLVVEGDTVIDASLTIGTQTYDSTWVYANIYDSEGYILSEEMGTLLTAKPTVKLTAADLGVAEGSTGLYYTITCGDKFIGSGSTACINADSYNIEFCPVRYGERLADGTYVINLYSITAGSDHSAVTPISQQTIKVISNDPVISFTRIADTATVSGSIKDKLLAFFNFYADGVKLEASDITDADATLVSGLNGQVAFSNVKLSLCNSTYGTFEVAVTGQGSNNFIGTVTIK